MKRILFSLICLVSALSSLADEVVIDYVGYDIDLSSKTAKVTNYYNNDISVINIPSSVTYNGAKIPVTTIGEFAFNECKNLTSITIPNSVTTIGKFAFSGCGITSIVIPKSLKHLEEMTFIECPQLKSVTFTSSDIEVDKYAFWKCENFKELIYAEGCTKIFAVIGTGGLTHVVLPSTATSIEKGAFAGEDITSIVIPASVTHIGDEAFSECESLKTVTMPNSVISIGKQAFRGCM